jgi:ribosomal subunit interface protein
MTKLAINIQGVNFNLGKRRDYVTRKVAKIVDFIPTKFRENAHANVKIEQEGKWFSTIIKLQLPGKVLFVREKATSVQAAIGNAERKIRDQIQRYKMAYLAKERSFATI